MSYLGRHRLLACGPRLNLDLADLNLCDSCVCWCRVPHREAMDKESFARSLYRDGSHEFLTSDLVVETLATDPKRGNIHLFACLVNHASVAWILWLTGCLWVTTPASIVQKLTSVRVTTVQVHDVAWKSQSACPCIRKYGCIQRGGGRRHERSHEKIVYLIYADTIILVFVGFPWMLCILRFHE